MRVLVIGAGTGGLCLAQGLKRAGIEVTVFERDVNPQHPILGSRMRISAAGSQALAECLAPDAFQRFVDTCAHPVRRLNLLTEKLKTLLTAAIDPGDDPVESERSVSRGAMRTALLLGLDDVVRFGKTFTHFARHDDDSLTAFFADGTSATGDVLVAADGSNSRVRRQYLPNAQVVDAGVTAVLGKVWLSPDTASLVPPGGEDAMTLVFAPGGATLAVHYMVFEGDHAERNYLSWGYSASRRMFKDLCDKTPEGLKQEVLRLTRSWHPRLRELFRQADPETVFKIDVRTSEPIEEWESSNVTLLGDAIHTMTPGRGLGANVALWDARELCRRLVAVNAGETSLTDAIAEYEANMRDYGFEAVLSSRKQISGDDPMHMPVLGRVVLALFRTYLRICNTFPPLKRRFLTG